MQINRSRLNYSLFIIITICLGLFSRLEFIPEFIYPYLGDMLYSILLFFIVGFICTRFSSVKVAIISLSICCAIEVSQFYQADWINEIRNFKLGGLILGYGFLWSDIFSYLVGTIFGYVFERSIYK